jgi:hypothetical protein
MINPSSQSIDATGGTGTVAVTAGAGCGWTATSNAPWLTVSQGASGSGNGTVTFAIAVNAGPLRTGTLTVAGRAFTVTQAAPCVFSINPTSHTFGHHGGNFDIAVTTAAGCSWTATTAASWITFAAAAGGSGNGTVTIRVANAAPNQTPRTGVVIIAGQTFTVQQQD